MTIRLLFGIVLFSLTNSCLSQDTIWVSDTARLGPPGFASTYDPVLTHAFQHDMGLTWLYKEGRASGRNFSRAAFGNGNMIREGYLSFAQGSKSYSSIRDTAFLALNVRYINTDGSLEYGPIIERQFVKPPHQFVGSPSTIAWTARESPPADDRFKSIVTRMYNEEGDNYATINVYEYQPAIRELFSYHSHASRHGSYVGVAVLSSFRKDQRGVMEEGGAILTVVIVDQDGDVVFRKTQALPDRRGRYQIRKFLVSDSGEAILAFEHTPFLFLPPTIENPLIPLFETLVITDDEEDFAPQELLLKNTQLHELQSLDLDPWPISIVAAYGNDLGSPTQGLRMHRLGDSRTTLTFDQTMLASLPEDALEPKRSMRKQLNLQFGLEELQLSPTGDLYALFKDRYMPVSTFSPELLQQVRSRDDFLEGAVLIKYETHNSSFQESTLSCSQSGAFLPLKQRFSNRNQTYYQRALGISMVPLKGEKVGLLFNEEIENLTPRPGKKRQWTAVRFSLPILATFENSAFKQEVLPYVHTHEFPLRVYPSAAHTLPGGTLIEFGAEEPSFQTAKQWGWFGW